jgi:hypothetical protein
MKTLSIAEFRARQQKSKPKLRKSTGPKESAIVTAILKHLIYSGIYAVRVNSGTFKIDKRIVRGAPAGTPDIRGELAPNGRAFYFEVKRPGQKMLKSQVAFFAAARRRGALCEMVTSVSEARSAMLLWTVKERMRA